MGRKELSGLRTITLGAVVLGMGAMTAQAAQIALPNASFETPAQSPDAAVLVNSGSYNWVGQGYPYIQDATGPIGTQWFGSTQDGDNVLAIDDRTNYGAAYLVPGVNVDATKTYQLKVQVGQLGDVVIGATTYTYDYAGYDIFLQAGYGNTVAEIKSSDVGATAAVKGQMVDVTLNYTPDQADDGKPFVIQLAGLNVGANNQVAFDNVRLSTVPEPASVSLLGLGAGALMLRRRRRA